jgi:carbonic anhydrase
MHRILSASGFLLLWAFAATAGEHGVQAPHWSYEGKSGPAHWAELGPGFTACSSGKNQSPLNLTNFMEAELPPIPFDYSSVGNQVVNTGHSVQINFRPGSFISIDGRRFELKQVHFHTPSENTINGKRFPMEAHFVHADAKGNLAVVALMFEQGMENAQLARALRDVPRAEGGMIAPSNPVSAASLLPEARDYYRYEGSLTTPPCSEGVRWIVLKHFAEATTAQLQLIHKVLGHDNSRPVQDAGARVVLQ